MLNDYKKHVSEMKIELRDRPLISEFKEMQANLSDDYALKS